MPQTLLSLLALAAAAFFTLGQKQASSHTVESIVLDEFEVAVAGALLHTTEFADSRAFDDATTPERLRVRLGLPQILTQTALDTLTLEDVIVPTSMFIAPARMGLSAAGAEARCNVVHQLASSDCDDVSDFNSRKPMSDSRTKNDPSAWTDVTLETPNGDPLPVEVHVEVHYVEATAPDVIVDYRTNHKRVDVWARSPLLITKYPDHTVQMHRVISFDPATALEYLKRTSCVVNDAQIAAVRAAEASVTVAQSAAEAAYRRVESAGAAIAPAAALVEQRQAAVPQAEAAAAAAQSALDRANSALQQAIAEAQAQSQQSIQQATRELASAMDRVASATSDVAQEQQNLNTYIASYNQQTSSWYRFLIQYYQIDPTRVRLASAQQDLASAQADERAARQALATAQQAAAGSQQAIDSARQSVATAQAGVETAQAGVAAAQRAVSSAQAALAAANAALAEARAAARAADGTLAAAVANLNLLTQCGPATPGGAPVYGGPRTTVTVTI